MTTEFFAVICKDDDGQYLLATSRAFSFEEAHKYVETVASSRHACVIPAGMVGELRSSTGNALKLPGSESMIVKCQYSLANNIGRPTMLFYNQERTQLGEFDVTWQWEQFFKSYGPKFYAEVKWSSSHALPEFLGKLDNQPW